MSNRGYGFEHFVEDYFLKLTDKKITDPIFNGKGEINRSFRVPGSGAMQSFDGDVITQLPFLTKQFYIECKHWKQKTKDGLVFRIPMRDLIKNITEAKKNEKLPLFMISFKGASFNRIQIIVDHDTMYILEILFGHHNGPRDCYIEGKKDWYKIGKTLILKKKGFDWLYSKSKEYKVNLNNEWYVISWDYFDGAMKRNMKDWSKVKDDTTSL